MSKTTRATQALTKAGVAFTLHAYDYDPNAERIGLQAAEALGEDPGLVLKTLMAEVDGKPVCVVIPSDQEVSMKFSPMAFWRMRISPAPGLGVGASTAVRTSGPPVLCTSMASMGGS